MRPGKLLPARLRRACRLRLRRRLRRWSARRAGRRHGSRQRRWNRRRRRLPRCGQRRLRYRRRRREGALASFSELFFEPIQLARRFTSFLAAETFGFFALLGRKFAASERRRREDVPNHAYRAEDSLSDGLDDARASFPKNFALEDRAAARGARQLRRRAAANLRVAHRALGLLANGFFGKSAARRRPARPERFWRRLRDWRLNRRRKLRRRRRGRRRRRARRDPEPRFAHL